MGFYVSLSYVYESYGLMMASSAFFLSHLLNFDSLLRKQNKLQVLLVDQSDRFVFKPMLYELLSGGNAISIVHMLLITYSLLFLSHGFLFGCQKWMSGR